MQGLYQWLSERASFFRYARSVRGPRRRVMTETTVRREGVTLLVGTAAGLDLDVCPFCGSKLAFRQSEQAKHQLSKESIEQKSGQVDGHLRR